MKRVLALLLAALMLAAGCSQHPAGTTDIAPADEQKTDCPGEPSAAPSATPEPKYTDIENKRTEPVNRFSLAVTLNADEHRLIVTQNLTYHNNTGKELDEIYFNLIPQAFRSDGGGVSVGSIIINNKKCSIERVKGTVYSIALPSALADKEQLDIAMEYDVDIPNIQNRFGYQGNVFNLGNFIASPAVYGADGWVVEPYVDLGDAFYTDIADYDVVINVPEGYTVAATGEEVGINTYHAENVRDFAFCASDSYDILRDEQDGVVIEVCYGGDLSVTAERIMQTAKRSLELCGQCFGKYPYEKLSIVMNGLTGGVSGMEYPMLVMISPDLPLEHLEEQGVDLSDSDEIAPYTISIDCSVFHEIAHQWFYGIVGNDQISEPWLDEGFCRFSEYLYQQKYPPEVKEDSGIYLMEDRFRDYYDMYFGKPTDGTTQVPDTTYLGKSLYYWVEEDPMGYWEIYDKGASLIYMMQQQMGEEAFSEAVKEYVQTFAYGFVTTDSFKEFWNGKADLQELFDMFLD